jgi:membrane associated rhomboid family serine protease
MASFLQRPVRYRFYNATIVLIAVNILVFLLGYVGMQRSVVLNLGMIPFRVVQDGAWWQLVTYMFVHSGWTHIFFNMLGLLMFGVQLEQRMGSTEFLLYYFVSGIGAGAASLALYLAAGQLGVVLVGASGAIFALLLAFAVYFPDARILLFYVIPLRAPTAVAVFAGIEIVSQFFSSQSGVAHLTHLAGLLFGGLYLAARLRMNPLLPFFRRR